MNKAAQALGRLAKGKKKKYSDEEIKTRTERLVKARKKYLDEKFKPNPGVNIMITRKNFYIEKVQPSTWRIRRYSEPPLEKYAIYKVKRQAVNAIADMVDRQVVDKM